MRNLSETGGSDVKRILTWALCLFMLLGLALPLGAGAEESGQKVVRVG